MKARIKLSTFVSNQIRSEMVGLPGFKSAAGFLGTAYSVMHDRGREPRVWAEYLANCMAHPKSWDLFLNPGSKEFLYLRNGFAEATRVELHIIPVWLDGRVHGEMVDMMITFYQRKAKNHQLVIRVDIYGDYPFWSRLNSDRLIG